MATNQQLLGKHGENLAATYLSTRGYVLIEQNWHCRAGEIDLVMQQGEEWVFVEVRTRRASDTNSAIESVTTRKQARMVAAAEAYVEANHLAESLWRIDLAVVAMTPSGVQIEVIENATGW